MLVIATNGVDTYVERRGEGSPIVFVHASIVDHHFWESQIEAFEGGHKTVAYDLRGHGRTGGSNEPVYTAGLLALDLAALVNALDLDAPIVVGHSWGGVVAVLLAGWTPTSIPNSRRWSTWAARAERFAPKSSRAAAP
jgi:pimeloyl-ACP methyl ester carboxylesterase